MSPAHLLGASAVVLIGAVLQGSVGFGLGMLAAPLLVWIDPALVPGPLLAAALLLTVLMARRERSAIDFKGMGWALGGRLPGTVAGAATIAAAPERQTVLLVGIMVFVAVALTGSGIRLTRSRQSLFGAGTLSGFMATTASIGGPPMALLYQDSSGARLRGTLSGFFLVGLVFSLSALAAVGRFGASEMASTIPLLPGVAAGFAVSRRLAPILDRGHTRRAVLLVSALAGLSVVARALAPS